ncbi:MAG: 3-isopropylmalate dehydratase small subunit [Spirochaetia bacterium]|jgi:3-isopropylmalate/(R)-2-methylmalate dehydratase small subunit
MRLSGHARLFGSNINTDDIVPARYLNTSDPVELALHLMEDARPGFIDTLEKGSIIVAGGNFGCGSSREHAPIAIRAAGVSCVVAEGFARIFFRNAINIGLPIVEVPGIASAVAEGETISVDLSQGSVQLASGRTVMFSPFPPFMEEIVRKGGWMPYLLARQGRDA